MSDDKELGDGLGGLQERIKEFGIERTYNGEFTKKDLEEFTAAVAKGREESKPIQWWISVQEYEFMQAFMKERQEAFDGSGSWAQKNMEP